MKNLTKNSIQQLLNASSSDIDAETLEQLHRARNRALERHQTLERAPVLAWLSQHGVSISFAPGSFKILTWVISFLVLLGLLGSFAYLQQINLHDHERSEIDLAILVDDLPVEVYIEQ